MRRLLAQTIVVGTMLIGAGRLGAEVGSNVEPGLTFYLPFEQDASAVIAGGNSNVLAGSLPGVLTNGIKGQGMLLNQKTLLQYAIPGNYRNSKGSLELWVQFLSGQQDVWQYLFSEEGPVAAGSQIFRVIVMAMNLNSIYYNFFDEYGHWSCTPFSIANILGEWQHIVITWDKDLGDRIYINGQFRPHSGGTCQTLMHNYQRGSKEYEKMTIGLKQSPAEIVLDEVKIYDRMLSDEEVAGKYQALAPVTLKIKPLVLRQNQPATVALQLQNLRAAPLTGTLGYQLIEAASGRPVVSEQTARVTNLAAHGNQDVSLAFTPSQAGEYVLRCVFNEAGTVTRNLKIYALPAVTLSPSQPAPAASFGCVRTGKPADATADLQLQLVKRFDCTQTYGTNEFCDDGASRVVDSPLGKYRETGTKVWSRFAYRFAIDTPQAPYLAEIEYPDDRERIIEFMIDNLTNGIGHMQTVNAGVLTGCDLPNTHRLIKLPVLFFPPDKECGLQVMNWPKEISLMPPKAGITSAPPAACKSITIYKVLGGLPPADLKNLPPPENQRLVGYENEDLSMLMGEFGYHPAPDFESIYRRLKNRMDYMAYTGQNLYEPTLVQYDSILYASDLFDRKSYDLSWYPGFWVDVALELCRERNIRFVPVLAFWINSELAQLAGKGPDKEGVVRGEDTICQVAWNGELSEQVVSDATIAYDILHPKVEEVLLKVVDEILAKYGDHPAFGGLGIWILPCNTVWFQSLKWGYGDRAIALFEKETGVKVPGEAGDPKRFLKRYLFLVKKDPAMQEQWVAWRCGKVKDFLMKFQAHLQAKNPRFILNLETWGPYASTGKDLSIFAQWKPWAPDSVYQFFKRGGFDFTLYKNIPNVYLGKIVYPNLRPADTEWYNRDFYFDPALATPYQNQGANSIWLEQWRREFDKMQYATPMTGYWFNAQANTVEKSAPIMPSGDYYLEFYANALADLDVRWITDGGMGVDTLGHEKELKDFIRAYRTLPAEYFELFGPSDDPLAVRARARPDGYYFYLVNREFYPLDVTLQFKGAEKVELVNLATDERLTARRGELKTVLGPFRLMSFRAPKDAILAKVSVHVPEKETARMQAQVQQVQADWKALNELKGLDENLLVELDCTRLAIEKAWAEKRYARLRHLLDSYPVKKIRRLLTDKTLQSYLLVPKSYRDAFYIPKQLTAKCVPQIPPLDSEVWNQAPAAETFSEIMQIEGDFCPRPATESPTKVQILYDQANIGFLFHCGDKEADRIIAKQVPRDGNVLAPDDDEVEVFLSAVADNRPYCHFMANFGGSKRDHRGYTKEHVYESAEFYNPEWTIETKKQADGWVARVVIPFQAMGVTPKAGDTWGLNLTRNQRGKMWLLQSDPEKGAHCPDYFARLTFG